MDRLSVAMQNYLETIYDLSRAESQSATGGVRVSDIALRLCVSKASVNSAMNVLARLGLVSNEKYQEIYLTEDGRNTAHLLESKHRIIKTLFTEVIGISDATADEDACAIEHIISPESVQKINEYLRQSGRGIP